MFVHTLFTPHSRQSAGHIHGKHYSVSCSGTLWWSWFWPRSACRCWQAPHTSHEELRPLCFDVCYFSKGITSFVSTFLIKKWFKCLCVCFEAEAMHIGSLIAAQGYFFPISDHILSLRDDGTFYRFQVKALYFFHFVVLLYEFVNLGIRSVTQTVENDQFSVQTNVDIYCILHNWSLKALF